MGILQEIRRAVLGPMVAEIGCSGFLTPDAFARARGALANFQVARLLDFGCGTGGFGLALARDLGCDLLGIDGDAASVAYAKASIESASLRAVFDVRRFEDDRPSNVPLCDAAVALDSLYLADDLKRALQAVTSYVRPRGCFWLSAYVGDTREGGVRSRTLATWLTHLKGAGLRIEEVFDATETWRELAAQLHRLRLGAATDLVAELGPAAGHQALAISQRMLGLDGRPAFLDEVSRIEITALRP
jgi:SAM-dependent methyltransferase